MSTTTIIITLEIEGDAGTVVDIVDNVLDSGVLQEAIDEYETDDGPVRVRSAVWS